MALKVREHPDGRSIFPPVLSRFACKILVQKVLGDRGGAWIGVCAKFIEHQAEEGEDAINEEGLTARMRTGHVE